MFNLNLLVPELEKRKQYLEELLSFINQQQENMPKGKLRISNNRGIPRYYRITDPKDTLGDYISKENQALANRLAEKNYLNKLKKEAEAELHDINNYLKKHNASNLEDIYRNMNEYRKNLITPLVLPDKMYVQQWKNESYAINPYFDINKIYPTKNDELVQSKSEAILADMYYDLGIPYRYDAELQLENGVKKYPDFTLLDVKNRRVIYHEHLGMLDDEGYRRKNLRKLDEYRRNGIYPGKNLIITHEADGSYLNVKEIRGMVKEIFGVS